MVWTLCLSLSLASYAQKEPTVEQVRYPAAQPTTDGSNGKRTKDDLFMCLGYHVVRICKQLTGGVSPTLGDLIEVDQCNGVGSQKIIHIQPPRCSLK